MIKKDKNTAIIIKEAKRLGIKVEILYPQRKLIALVKGSKRFLVQRDFRINLDRFGTRNIPLFKDLSYFFWQKNNIPIPKTITAFSLQEAKRKIKKIPFSLVIKDAQASQSRNLWVNISDLPKAISVLKNLFSNPLIEAVIIQEFIRGKEFRVLALKDKILGIAQLIPHPSKEYSKISEGGQVKNILLDSIHPEIKKMCIKAIKITGLELAGLDIIAEDISKSPKEQKIKFIEINGRPDVYIHHYPNKGKPVNVTKKILKYIFNL